MIGERDENPVPIAAGVPFVVTTYYRNSGHEPATKVHLLDVLAEIYTAEQYDNGLQRRTSITSKLDALAKAVEPVAFAP